MDEVSKRVALVHDHIEKLGGDSLATLLKKRALESPIYLEYIEQLLQQSQLNQKVPLTDEAKARTSNRIITNATRSFTPLKEGRVRSKGRETAVADDLLHLSDEKRRAPLHPSILKMRHASPISTSTPNIKDIQERPSLTKEKYDSINCVLEDSSIQEMFHLFVKKQRCEENLYFLLKVRELASVPLEALLSAVEDIYREFIKPGSPQQLNLDFGVATACKGKVEALEGNFNEEEARNIFSDEQRIIMELLQQDTFLKFSTTPQFIDYKKYALAEEITSLVSSRKESKQIQPSAKVDFSDLNFIIREPLLGRELLTFLKRYHCEENYYFLKQLVGLEHSPTTKILHDIKEIYKRFIEPRSPDEVNLDAEMRANIAMDIYDLEQNFDEAKARNIFAYAKDAVVILIQMNSLPKFLASPEYEDCKKTFTQIRGQTTDSQPSNISLSSSDWDVIYTGSTTLTFSRGENIITQGEKKKCIYILINGTIMGRCTKNNKKIALPLITEEGSVFGEMSLFSQLPAYSSYVVQSDTATVREIHTSFLFRLFEAQPQLGVKMYNYVGLRLSMMVTHTDKGATSHKLSNSVLNPVKVHKSESPRPQTEFNKIFTTLPESEKLIVSHHCTVPRSVFRSGVMFISQHYLGFSASIFGQKCKELYPLFESTTTITSSKDLDIIALCPGQKRKFRMKNKETRDIVMSLLESLLKVKEPSDVFSPRENLNSKELTEEEWKLILGTGDSCIQFQKGDYIMQEGCTYKTLFQTMSGTCDVEKQIGDISDTPEVIGTVAAGEVLGEINFFTQNAASASVIVTSNSAEVYLIEKEYLWGPLLSSHPNIVLRFYFHLCNVVGTRLTKHT